FERVGPAAACLHLAAYGVCGMRPTGERKRRRVHVSKMRQFGVFLPVPVARGRSFSGPHQTRRRAFTAGRVAGLIKVTKGTAEPDIDLCRFRGKIKGFVAP